MNDEIKKLLGEELAGQVAEKLGDTKLIIDTGNLIVDDGKMIPKARFDEVNQKAQEYKSQLETQKTEFEDQLNSVNDELKKLSETAKLTDEQKQKITDLTASNEKMKTDYEEKLKDQKLHHKIDLKLIEAGAKNIKSVKALLDFTKISLDGENILGLDDQVKSLKENDDYLFGEIKKVGETPPDGDNPPPAPNKLEKEYDETVKKHGLASIEALALKRQMFEKKQE